MIRKETHLVKFFNLDDPRLASVKAAANPAVALVTFLATPPRPRYWLEVERKADALAYLKAQYAAWRRFDPSSADRVAGMSLAESRRERALRDVSLLGRAWWGTGDPAYGAAFQKFYLGAPTGALFTWGVFGGYQVGVELDAYLMLADCPGLTAAGRIACLDHLLTLAHAAWDTQLVRWSDLTLGPEGHNWWVLGGHGLPALAWMFPEARCAAFLLKSAWSVIEEHVRGHYRADGGARETTPGYQLESLLHLWQLHGLARLNAHPVSAGFDERLLRATRFLLDLMTPAGGLPAFGDNSAHAPGALTELASVAAALSGDRACKWYAEYARARRPAAAGEAAGAIPLPAFWRVGLRGALAYAKIRPWNPRTKSVLMGATGYAALRTALAPSGLYLGVAAADRGPVVTSHGHNEVFSIEAHAGGVRFIGDMGNAPYGASSGRAYDEKTEAHSCLAIAGEEQPPIVTEWRWAGCVIPCVRRWISEDTHDFWHGVHEGFYHYPSALTLHARKIFFIKAEPACWIVMDWLESKAVHLYQAYFHGCVPGCIEGSAVVLGEAPGARLAIIPPEGRALNLVRVRNQGRTAYLREKKLNSRSYPCFAFSRRARSECFIWVLAPLGAGRALPRVRRLPVTLNGAPVPAWVAAAVEITAGGVTDALCVSHKEFDAELAFGAHTAWGCLAFRRRGAGGVKALSVTRGVADGGCGR